MKQVIQNFKSGLLYIDDVPAPALAEKMVLIENRFSLISAGTEKSTVKVGQANLLGKARQRPDLVAQVYQNIKKEGLKATFEKVKTKLDSLKALGYSSCGEVIASLDTNRQFKTGDRVACAGQDYASHAEVVCVPQNLVAKIPDNVTYEEAAFTTLGAIALQGVRQADPKIGEKICVIGLGLLGQLTVQLLNANGCSVLGIDINEKLIDLLNKSKVGIGYNRNDSNLNSILNDFTNGIGFDSVIITAATLNNDPIVLATEILRKKGKIIIVGSVKMDIPREPNFYKKELELKISCSYGPGRYDKNYEELGNDYPISYVRWTEQRNMSAFLELLSLKKIQIEHLITHTFDIEDAEKGFDLILGSQNEFFLGILINYPNSQQSTKEKSKIQLNNLNKSTKSKNKIGFVGAGSFAQSYLLPNLKKMSFEVDGVATSKGITSKNVAEKFNINFCTTNSNDIIQSEEIGTIFIATPHNSHGKLTIEALKANKNIFVEKPLALNIEELKQIFIEKNKSNSILMVGYNRRFSPLSNQIYKYFESITEPIIINIRVNAGFIPKDHWTQIEEIGGGRIIGEICHFVDLIQYFTKSNPIKVYADCIDNINSTHTNEDNISITIKFKNGSIGNIIYLANGDKSLPKEKIEVFGGGKIGIINDFRSGEIYQNNKHIKIKATGKGHYEEIENFMDSVKNNTVAPISFESICYTSLTTFKIKDSIITGLPQLINIEEIECK
jgi:predicted dehydrogenase/threonine dehydrogenase-like Zn-dependent dehydrogenase